MVSAKLKTTFIKMVRESVISRKKDIVVSAKMDEANSWTDYYVSRMANRLGYEVTSTTDGAPAWKDALREIWKNEEEDSIILFCYSPYQTVPYYLKFIEEYTTTIRLFSTKKIEGMSIGIDKMGYEETSVPFREDVSWLKFTEWAGLRNADLISVEFKTSIKGGWIFRKPIRIPEPYNMTLPPTLVKNLKKAMKELKPTL